MTSSDAPSPYYSLTIPLSPSLSQAPIETSFKNFLTLTQLNLIPQIPIKLSPQTAKSPLAGTRVYHERSASAALPIPKSHPTQAAISSSHDFES